MADDAFLGIGSIGLLPALLALKRLVPALRLGSGASGGLFTPTLATGAALGGALRMACSPAWPGSPSGAFAMAGAAAMLGAAMQAPLAGLALVLERTHSGFGLMIPMVAATVTAAAVVSTSTATPSTPPGRPRARRRGRAAEQPRRRGGQLRSAAAGSGRHRRTTRKIRMPRSGPGHARPVRRVRGWTAARRRVMGPWDKRDDMIVHESEPYNAEPPPGALADRMLTPLDSFYSRNHGPVPVIDPRAWRLRIGGLADRDLDLSLADLRSRFAPQTITATLQCAGNRRAGLIEVRTSRARHRGDRARRPPLNGPA